MRVVSRSKAKGSRIEREIVELMKGLGCEDAERVPMSGMLGGKYKDDVSFTLVGEKLTTEVKARANGEGFAVIEKWLGSADALFLRKDNAKPLVVLPWHVWAWLVNACQGLRSFVVNPDAFKLERPAQAPKKKPASRKAAMKKAAPSAPKTAKVDADPLAPTKPGMRSISKALAAMRKKRAVASDA